MKARILLNDFKAQWQLVGSNVLQAVERVGQSGWLILGNEVKLFEQALAEFIGSKNVVGCASGLDGLEIALRVAGLQFGDEVITTPLSAFASTLAILRAGGRPHFVDIDQSGLLDLRRVEARLKEQPNQKKFLVPVHLYGHSLDLDQLQRLKTHYNARIIEDCAQSIGATSDGQAAGSVGQLSATSFYPTKNLGCMGDGGAILTDSEEYATAARQLRDYGQQKKYLHTLVGLNSRLDELQAALLRDALLPRLDQFTQRRRAIAAAYLNGIENSLLTIPAQPSRSNSVYHLFPVLVTGDREKFRQHLSDGGIESGIHYPILIPDQPAMKGQPFTVSGELAEARRFANSEVSLPIHPYLADGEVQRVIDACNSWSEG